MQSAAQCRRTRAKPPITEFGAPYDVGSSLRARHSGTPKSATRRPARRPRSREWRAVKLPAVTCPPLRSPNATSQDGIGCRSCTCAVPLLPIWYPANPAGREGLAGSSPRPRVISSGTASSTTLGALDARRSCTTPRPTPPGSTKSSCSSPSSNAVSSTPRVRLHRRPRLCDHHVHRGLQPTRPALPLDLRRKTTQGRAAHNDVRARALV
jgi:hypothetical protein